MNDLTSSNESGIIHLDGFILSFRSLQRTLTDLKEYQQQHEAWQALQENMQQDQATSDTKFAQRVGYEAYKIRKMAAGAGRYQLNLAC